MTNSPWDEEPQDVAASAAPKYDYEPPKGSTGEIVQTVKFGTGFDAPWLVAHGPDAKTINTITNTVDYRTLVDTTVQVARYAQKAWASSASTGSTATAVATTEAPRPQPDRSAPPNGEKKYCSHGERQYKEGVSKAGKTYKAYFCSSQDKDAQCAPEWAK